MLRSMQQRKELRSTQQTEALRSTQKKRVHVDEQLKGCVDANAIERGAQEDTNNKGH